MTRQLAVWAPMAGAVAVDLSRPGQPVIHRTPMSRDASGWWRVEVSSELDEVDYAFRLDAGRPLPDPRSGWQPYGVHAPSRWFDPTRHEWHDDDWRGPRSGAGVLGGVFYELHVGTFTPAGTLDAAVERLGHLVELGVDVVEVMPVAPFPGDRGWGYDGVFPYAVHTAYGGPAALQRFVDACHGMGLAVCLDVVHNHLGPVGNYLAAFGPYLTDRHHTPWGPAMNLDGPGSGEVRRFLIDSALRWFRDFHVDALRLDAVHELHDTSPRHLLAELADETARLADELGRPLALVAESDLNDPVMIEPVAGGGRGMTAQWDDDVHHAVHVRLTGETQGYYADFADPGALAKTLTRAFFHDGGWSSFRGRRWGRPVDPQRVDARRFLAYLQTHDQVGNRAVGDRIHHALPAGHHALGAALYLLSAFTPMVFMGEEWAASTPWQFFTSYDDDIGASVRDGRRAEFARHGWAAQDIPDPQDPATHGNSVLRWDELTEPDHDRMLRWYRSLIEVRRWEPVLTDGRLDLVRIPIDEPGGVVAMVRGDIAVVGNVADGAATIALERLGPVDGCEAGGAVAATVLLAFDEQDTARGRTDLSLPGGQVVVLRLRPGAGEGPDG